MRLTYVTKQHNGAVASIAAFLTTRSGIHIHTHVMGLAYVNTGQHRDAVRKATFVSRHSGIHAYGVSEHLCAPRRALP